MKSSSEDEYALSGSSPVSFDGAPGRKRRASESLPQAPEMKKTRYGYHKGYLMLLNDMVKEIINPDRSNYDTIPHYQRFEDSQIGSVRWSGDEKFRFFTALDRKGRDDIRGIADSIGSKSEPEVETYIRLLQRQIADRHRRILKKQRLADARDMIAAVEISPECEEALSGAADGLAIRQMAWEESVEVRKYGSLWRVDEDTDLPALLKDQASGRAQHLPSGSQLGAIQAASKLFQLENMMVLSRSVFMNSRDSEFNYRTYASEGQLPSIQLTALLDLHNLIVTITKRLASTAHFMAMSRRKSTPTGKGRDLKPYVKAADVIAALDALKMRKNNDGYLLKAIRSCNIGVHETKRGTKYKLGDEVPYEEVEELFILRRQGKYKKRGRAKSDPTSQEAMDMDTASEDELSQSSADLYSELSSDEDLLLQDLSLGDGRNSAQALELREEAELQEDEYLEAVDQKHSKDEERNLWTILEGDYANDQITEDIDLPKPPARHRKSVEDLVDWRLWTAYKSPWEHIDTPIQEELFELNAKLMSKRQQARLLSEMPEASNAQTNAPLTTETRNLGYSDTRHRTHAFNSGDEKVGEDEAEDGNEIESPGSGLENEAGDCLSSDSER